MCLVHLRILDLFDTNTLASIRDRFILTLQVKGQGIYAFVTLVDGVSYSEELRKSLILTVRKQVSLLFPTQCSYDNGIFQDTLFQGAIIASTLSWSSGNSKIFLLKFVCVFFSNCTT